MGVMDRARQAIPSSDGRDWLDEQKDDLVREATPLAILDINYDQNGKFGPRWVIAVEGYYDDVEVEGKLSFGANPTRNPMFEELQSILEEAEQKGENGIGPICMIRAKSQNGYRYYSFADVDPETGKPILPAQATEQANGEEPRRRQRPPREEVRQEETKPVAQTRRSTGQRQRAQEAEQQSENGEEAPKRGRGRPRGSATRQQELPDGRQAATLPVQPGVPAAPQAAVAQEISPQGATGTAVCPHCEQELTGRVFPNTDDPESGPVMIHRCPKTNSPVVLPAEVA